MGKKIIVRYAIVFLLSVLICFFIAPSGVWAQRWTHTVQNGDTLWDICEKYYGDPNLWPKLWQMNDFITNPHLLEPGDIITLFEKEVVEEVEEPEVVEEAAPVIEEEPEPIEMGIDLEGLTNTAALGFLSLEEIQPWGSVFASENETILLSKDDTAFVIFEEDKDIKIGDKYSVGSASDLLKHPVTGKDLGYTFYVKGALVVEERLGLAHRKDEFYQKKNVFKIRIIEAYEEILIGDTVILYQSSSSSCVRPVSKEGEILANIVAAKNQQKLIHPYSIVYIDAGSKDGIRRGNVFEVLEGNIVPDPKPGESIKLWKSNLILSDRQLGKIMILETTPETSTAIVLSALEPFSPGVYIKNLSWEETPEFLTSIFSCPID